MKTHCIGCRNTGLATLLGLLFLLCLNQPGEAQVPSLTITNEVPGISIYWPAATSGYVLQWTTNLAAPVSWQVYPVSPSVAGGNFVVSLPPTNPQAFFQLISGSSTPSFAPAVVTMAADPVNTTVAYLYGTVLPNGLDSTYWFEYGTDTTYGQTTPPGEVDATNQSPVSVYYEITALTGGTTYHCQLVASNLDGISTGGDVVFATAAPLPDAIIETYAASNITTTVATLDGSLNPNGSFALAFFQWGATTSYGNSTTTFYSQYENYQPENFSANVTGLAPSSTYHYRVVAYNGGPDEVFGNDVMFTTSAPFQQPPPAVITLPVSSVTASGAIFNGDVNPNGADAHSYFEYGTNTGYGFTTAVSDVGAGGTSVNLNYGVNLAPATAYHYRIVAYNSGGSSDGADVLFTTSNQPSAGIALTCASNVVVTGSSTNGAIVYFSSSASGGCSTPTVAANPPSGSTFPYGTTTVYVTAHDTCGDSTNCAFSVTVNHPVYPLIDITCASNVVVTGSSTNGAIVYFSTSASGGCTTPAISASPPSGSTFPYGTTTVYVTAHDTCGDSTNCAFSVTVNHPVYPLIDITCASNVVVTGSSTNGAIVYFSTSASGGCSTPTIAADPPSGSTFPYGTTTVYVTARDSCGDSTNCSLTVTVNRPVYPPIVLTCASNVVVTATSTNGAIVYFSTSASGGCSTPTIAADPPSGSTFPYGTTTVYVTAHDTCGDSTNCAFSVTVNHPVYPLIVLTCASNVVVTATSTNGAIVYFSTSASGGCSTPSVSADPPSGSTFPYGTTTVYVTARDSCGDSTNCSLTVTVNAPVYPPIVLTCASNVVVTATSTNGAIVYFSTSASGGCSTPSISANPPSGSTFPVGSTTVFTTARDSCGDSTNCSLTVTVDPLPIVLTCASNIVVTESRAGGTLVYFSTSASGGCSTPSVSANPPSGSNFPVGTTTVLVTASDACGGSTNCSFQVKVNP